MTRVLITGGRGFLGRNLAAHLLERRDCDTRILDRDDSADSFEKKILEADIIFHLAAVNRSQDPTDFVRGNADLTRQMCNLLRKSELSTKIVFTSSIEAGTDSPYGNTKAEAEAALKQFATETGAEVRIYRLNNLFGKWCRPNYNSVTATFCHNIANDLPIAIIGQPGCVDGLSDETDTLTETRAFPRERVFLDRFDIDQIVELSQRRDWGLGSNGTVNSVRNFPPSGFVRVAALP